MNIEEMNLYLREVAVSVEGLAEYFRENIDLCMDYITYLVQTIPVPVRYVTVDSHDRIELHFICLAQGSECSHNYDNPLVLESQLWEKWLKLAVVSVNVGISVLRIGQGSSVHQVKSVYDEYRPDSSDDFLKIIRDIFLTEEEQDELLREIQENGLAESLQFDAGFGNWLCTSCRK